ncbi:unnamed protein product, partial [Mesorhabditis spiculigera]
MNRSRSRESDEENVPSGSDSRRQSQDVRVEPESIPESDTVSGETSETARIESEAVEGSEHGSIDREEFGSETLSLTSEADAKKEEEDAIARNRDFIIQQMPCNRIWYPPPWLRAERLFRNPMEFRVGCPKKMTLLESHNNFSYYSPTDSQANKSKPTASIQKNNQNTTAFRHSNSKFRMGGGIGGGMGGGIGGGIGGGMGGRMCGDGDSFHEPPPGHVRPANQNRTFYY